MSPAGSLPVCLQNTERRGAAARMRRHACTRLGQAASAGRGVCLAHAPLNAPFWCRCAADGSRSVPAPALVPVLDSPHSFCGPIRQTSQLVANGVGRSWVTFTSRGHRVLELGWPGSEFPGHLCWYGGPHSHGYGGRGRILRHRGEDDRRECGRCCCAPPVHGGMSGRCSSNKATTSRLRLHPIQLYRGYCIGC